MSRVEIDIPLSSYRNQPACEYILDEQCIQSCFSHQMPNKFLHEFLSSYLKKKNIIDEFEDSELSVISEFLLYSLIFIKEEVNVSNDKAAILLNIFMDLLKHNNIKFKAGSIKTKENDYERFKILLQEQFQKKQFDLLQIRKIMNFAKETYFDMYHLYEKINQTQKKEQFTIQIMVDQPQYIPPLKEALYMGNLKVQIHQQDDLTEHEISEQDQNEQKSGDMHTFEDENINLHQKLIKNIDSVFDQFSKNVEQEIEKENITIFQKANIT